ncbi:MAG: extradiol dioxygenase [Nonomuraea sp.]|nr:extradiol dioxygenase [Nonomuraea sp.]
MIGHLGVNVPDLAAAKAYYDQVMPLLEFEEFLSAEDQFAYRPAGGKPGTYLFFYPALQPGDHSPDRAGLQHLAFMVRTRAAVDEVAALVAGLGSEIVEGPREYPQYPPPYYAVFWRDPFGFKLEAVCHRDA